MTEQSNTPAPAAVAAVESKERFVDASDPFAQKFGIMNGKGQYVSRSYLKAYVECNCREPQGYVASTNGLSRTALIEYFVSDAFITECLAAGYITASKIGGRAGHSLLWKNVTEKPKVEPKATKTAATPVLPPAAPATDDPEAAAFAAAAAALPIDTAAMPPSAPATGAPANIDVSSVSTEARKTRRQRLAEEASRIMSNVESVPA
jgi:hypothetical protein